MPADATVTPSTDPLADPVQALVDVGGRFMVSQEMESAAEPFDMNSGAFYFRGRVASLGDVSAATAASALAIFPASLIELVWERSAAMPAAVALTGYHDSCMLWGQRMLAPLDDPERLHTLAERVVDGCDATGLVLFAAWQAQPRPEDDTGRAAFALMLLRELRGGLHFAALRAHGIDIPVAVLADPKGGVSRLRRTGWRHEQVEELERRAAGLRDLPARWEAAQAMTDAACGATFEVLSAEERDELDHLIVSAESISR